MTAPGRARTRPGAGTCPGGCGRPCGRRVSAPGLLLPWACTRVAGDGWSPCLSRWLAHGAGLRACRPVGDGPPAGRARLSWPTGLVGRPRSGVLGRGRRLRIRAGCFRVLARVAWELLSPRRPARGSSIVGLTRSGARAAVPRPHPGLWESSHGGGQQRPSRAGAGAAGSARSCAGDRGPEVRGGGSATRPLAGAAVFRCHGGRTRTRARARGRRRAARPGARGAAPVGGSRAQGRQHVAPAGRRTRPECPSTPGDSA